MQYMFNNNPHLILLFVLISHFSFSLSLASAWDYNKGGADWEGACQEGPQAPLDIAKPFTYRQTNLSFAYSSMMTQYSFYNDGNNLILEGDFGHMEYNGDTFFSTQIMFYSPSMHTIDHEHLPLEMQILHFNKRGEMVTVAVVFKKSEADYSLLLGKLHFDLEDTQKMMPFQPIFIKDQINLSKYLHSEQSYFIYDTLETIPPCSKRNTMVILSDILYVSRKQLDNFPLLMRNKNKLIQDRGERKLYVTFDIDSIKTLIASNKDIVNRNKQRKVEETKIELVKQQNSNDNKHGLNISALEANGTSSADIQKALQVEMKKMLILKPNKTQTKSNKKVVPFELVKERAVAKDTLSKKVDLKPLGSGVNGNETMVIDQEIPSTKAKLSANEILKKYEKWKKLKKKLDKSSNPKPLILLQLSQLENELLRIKVDQISFDDSLLNPDRQDNFSGQIFQNNSHFITEPPKKTPQLQLQEKATQKDKLNTKGLEEAITYYNELEDITIRRFKRIDNYNDSFIKLKNLKCNVTTNKDTLSKEHFSDLLFRIGNEMRLLIRIYFNYNEEEHSVNKPPSTETPHPEQEDIHRLQQKNKMKSLKSDIQLLIKRLSALKRTNEQIQKDKIKPNEGINEKLNVIEDKIESILVLLIGYKEEHQKERGRNGNRINQLEQMRIQQDLLIQQNHKIIAYINELENELEAKLQSIHHQHEADVKKLLKKKSEVQEEATKNKRDNHPQRAMKLNLMNEKDEDDDLFSFVRIFRDYSKEDINEQIQVNSNNREMLKEKLSEFNGTFTYPKDILNRTTISLNKTIVVMESQNNSEQQSEIDEEKEEKETAKSKDLSKIGIEDNEKIFKDTLLRINEKFVFQPKAKPKMNLKHQPHLSPSTRDYQLMQILHIMFKQLKFKLFSYDQANQHSPSYSPYLTEEGKIIITLTSLQHILKYSYDLLSIQFIEDNKSLMMSKYTEEILKEQKSSLFASTPSMYLFNNATMAEVHTLSEDLSSSSINSHRIKEIIIDLMNNSPLILINGNHFLKQAQMYNSPLENKECKGKAYQQVVILNKQWNQTNELQLTVNMITPDEAVVQKKSNKVVIKGNFGSFQQGAHYYEIARIELYSPSMHVFDDTKHRAVMEMFLIGKDAYERYSIVAVMFSIGKSTNPFLDGLGIGDSVIKQNYDAPFPISKDNYLLALSSFIPSEPDFVGYQGPMISTPCTKSIQWYVLTNDRLILTQDQFYAFKRLFK